MTHAPSVPPHPSQPAHVTSAEYVKLISRYPVLRIQSEANNATVYEVRDLFGDGTLLMRVLHTEMTRWPNETIMRFLREAELQRALQHPSIPRIIDSGLLLDGRPYYVSERLEGRSLEERIATEGRVALADALDILEPICDALRASHRQGIVHRNLRARSILIPDDRLRPRAVLTDFSLAKSLCQQSLQLTRAGSLSELQPGLAPEQVRGDETSVRTDIFALGSLSLHMLTGTPPYGDAPSPELEHRQLTGQLSGSTPSFLPPAISEVLRRSTSADPDDRHPEVDAFWADLCDAAGTRQTRACPDSSAEEDAEEMLAVYLEAGTRACAHDSSPQEAVEAVATLLENAEEELGRLGYTSAFETNFARLFVLPSPAGRVNLERAAQAVVELGDKLVAMAKDTPMYPGVRLHKGAIRQTVDGRWAGPLLQTHDWVPSLPIEGVTCTEDFHRALGRPKTHHPLGRSSGSGYRLS